MRLISKKIIVFLICVCALFNTFSVEIFAESLTAEKITLTVAGGGSYPVRVLNVSYENNRYLSLGDVQRAFADTEKAFTVKRENGSVNIFTSSTNISLENESQEESEDTAVSDVDYENWGKSDYGVLPAAALEFDNLYIDGNLVKYYHVDVAGDCFFSPFDLEFILNVTFEFTGEDMMSVDCSQGLKVDPGILEIQDYFFGINTALVGDASTGEIFYEYNGGSEYPIASTTKLMTYLVVMDGIENGEISMGDIVTIPKEAAKLSRNGDVVIPLTAGNTATMPDLLDAILLPSSNEAALTLAIHLCGSEEAFVERMNEKAKQLQMETAEFYNCNGLPVFNDEVVAAKYQNRMSAEDMFKLSAHILNNYPQITEITSKKSSVLASFGNKEVKNTNQLLYNMQEVTGLKTGTTVKSGACLVTSLKVNDGTLDHDLVVVVLGAEDNRMRFRYSQLLASYGKGVILKTMTAQSSQDDEEQQQSPVSSKAIVNYVINYAKKNK